MRPLTRRSVGGLVLAAWAAVSLAATAGEATPDTSDSEEAASTATYFATATVRERPLDTATAAVTVLERTAIEATGAETVADVLRFVPGVDLSSQGTRGGISTAQIRGGDPNFTLVLLDGVALNDGTYQVGEVFNLEGLPASAIERIEIVRGPLSSHYGSAGLAGAIHIVTRDSLATTDASHPASAAEDRFGVETEASLGDARFGRARAALSGASRRGSFFVDISGQRERERVADERFEQVHVQGRGRFAWGPRAVLEVAGRVTAWEGDDYPEASGGPQLGSGALRRAENRESSLGAVLRVGRTEARRHRIEAALYRHGLERDSPAIGFLVPPAVEDTTYTRSRLGWSMSLDPRPGIQVSVGADVVREIGDNESTLLLPPAFGGSVEGDYRLERTTPAISTELLARRGVWTLELGARVDWTERPGSTHGGAEVSPRFGVRVRPRNGPTQVRASIGRAFKLPSFFALASPRALGGNPGLEPETMVGADVGVERSFGDDLDAGVTLFAHRYENLVDFDFATFLHVNRGEVEAEGIETFVRWRPRPAWLVSANATWQQVEDADLGDILRHRPDWVVGLRLGWQPRAGLAVHVDGRWVSRFRDEQIPVPERESVAAHTLVGATVDTRLARTLRLRARVDNLFDESYEARIGFPGAGRAVRLSLLWRAR